jgi:hypothetical protein
MQDIVVLTGPIVFVVDLLHVEKRRKKITISVIPCHVTRSGLGMIRPATGGLSGNLGEGIGWLAFSPQCP